MLHTLASHRPYSLSRTIWHMLAGLVLVVVTGFILACFVGYVVLLILAMVVGG